MTGLRILIQRVDINQKGAQRCDENTSELPIDVTVKSNNDSDIIVLKQLLVTMLRNSATTTLSVEIDPQTTIADAIYAVYAS
jgi:hypothetical protein